MPASLSPDQPELDFLWSEPVLLPEPITTPPVLVDDTHILVGNRYGQIAQGLWTRYAPGLVKDVESPGRFFAALGEDVAQAVSDASYASERRLSLEMPYVERVRALVGIQRHAEARVLGEMVYSPLEHAVEDRAGWAAARTLIFLLQHLPQPSQIWLTLTTIPVDDDTRGWCNRLSDLVQVYPENMTVPAIQRHIIELEPYIATLQQPTNPLFDYADQGRRGDAKTG